MSETNRQKNFFKTLSDLKVSVKSRHIQTPIQARWNFIVSEAAK
jgi:hypothetical protein